MLKNKIFVKRFFLFFIVFWGFNFNLKTQTIENKIDIIEKQFIDIRDTKCDAKIKIKAEILDSLFCDFLSSSKSFNISLDKLQKYCSVIISEDKKLKIITWNIYFRNGEYFYYGYAQYLTSDDEFNFVKLEDKSDFITKPEMQYLDAQNWYGCLYYEIVEKKHKKQKYYTLIGWDGNTFVTNKKIIDVLTIKNNKLKFGFPFEIENKKYKRLIFEYNNQASMLLKWDKKKNIIVWDHLSPKSSKQEGMYEFYGPDFTYDAIKFKKGKWVYLKNIYIENSKQKK